jgi:hypothetical protein
MYKVVYNACYGGFSFSKEAEKWIEERTDIWYRDLPRHDKLLVECVETFGEKVNGSFSSICIKEIDQPQYKIDEYDGWETVVTPGSIVWRDASK